MEGSWEGDSDDGGLLLDAEDVGGVEDEGGGHAILIFEQGDGVVVSAGDGAFTGGTVLESDDVGDAEEGEDRGGGEERMRKRLSM